MRCHQFLPIFNVQYIFSQFSIVWDFLQRVATRYRQLYTKYVLIFFWKNDGNAW